MELLNEEELAELLDAQTAHRSRAYYRHKAIHGDKGAKKNSKEHSGYKDGQVAPMHAETSSNIMGRKKQGIGFLMGTHFAVLENCGTTKIPVCRRKGDGKASVFYKTVQFEATGGEDFVHKEGTLVFGPGEVLKYIEIEIVSRWIIYIFAID